MRTRVVQVLLFEVAVVFYVLKDSWTPPHPTLNKKRSAGEATRGEMKPFLLNGVTSHSCVMAPFEDGGAELIGARMDGSWERAQLLTSGAALSLLPFCWSHLVHIFHRREGALHTIDRLQGFGIETGDVEGKDATR
jgi:hypothetical protein